MRVSSFAENKKFTLRKTVRLMLAVFCGVISFLEPASLFSQTAKDSITISLITCYPGPEIYELCGHEAIRVRSEKMDSVWNYGTFDFAEPNFVYRFVKGETDYILSSYPFEYFLPGYQRQNRKIVEQELNLTQDEAYSLYRLIQKEALPQYRKYRYNYVKDNCATRIIMRLEQAIEKDIAYPDSIAYGTFRRQMRAYHKNYPWYQFGIDLALGSGIDYPLRSREEMFAPIDMMVKFRNAHFVDGRPLVRNERVIYEGVPDATLPPTPFYATPLFVSLCILLLSIGIAIYDFKKKLISRWFISSYFAITGLGGCLITFLVFFSSHEATDPNVLILWLNPLQLIFAVTIWWKKLRLINLTLACYNIGVVGLMLIVWPFQSQSANPAFFPLMACNVILGTTFVIVSSYNKPIKVQSSRRKQLKRTTKRLSRRK